MKLNKLSAILMLPAILSSCTVMNNLYVSDPEPLEKGNGEFHIGGSTGLRPKVDRITADGDIVYSGDVSLAPNFNLGGQYGISDRINLRASMHLPYVVGGFGLRAGPQFSFFEKGSKFNMAPGADGGFVLAKDSITILGSTSELDIQSNGSIGAAIYLPISLLLGESARLILTPRYSFGTIYMRNNENYRGTWKYHLKYPSLSLGLRLKKVHFEASLLRIQDAYHPNFGIVYFIETGEENED